MPESSNWQQQTLERLLFASLKEQRSKRRWGIFFKLLIFGYLFALLYLGWPSHSTTSHTHKRHTALVEIHGEIADESQANADDIAAALHAAFRDPLTQGIILRINSPGGSAVQADYIYSEIVRLRAQYPKKKIYAVCTDICASAAYYIAASTDQIYANGASLVGSIGVLMNGFGFVDGMHKLGIERRLLTAGSHKGFLDPFSPMQANEQQFAQTMLQDVHQQFIGRVKLGRGTRLKDNPDLFSGLIWTGRQALSMGLIDGIASPGMVARNVIGCENIVDYTVKPNYLEQLANRFSASLSREIRAQFTGQKLISRAAYN